MSDTLDIFCRDSVDVNLAYNELRRALGQDQGDPDLEANEDESFNLPIEEIADAMSPARDQSAVKMLLRSHNLDVLREERKLYWRSIYLRLEAASASSVVSPNRSTSISDAEALVEATSQLYKETVMTCFGSMELPNVVPDLPSCVADGPQSSYYLTDAGKISLTRVLTCFAYNSPDVRYCPMIYPIASIVRHYLSEEDTYGLLVNLSNNKRVKFLFETELRYNVAWRVAMDFCFKYTKKSMNFLESVSNRDEVEQIFQEWLWWIFKYLPFPHVVRIMDSFLFEGNKVLYRVCFCIVHNFAKRCRIKNSPILKNIKDNGLKNTFRDFCRTMPVSPNELLERSFKFRGFSKSAIQKASIHVEVDLKSGNLKSLTTLSAKSIRRTRSQSPDNLPTPDDVHRIHAVSSTLTYRELVTLWHWLPERMTMSSPVLAYSSNEHGLSMQTFYARSELYEPTILVIRTTNQEIFGAYCSTTWAQRNLKNDRGFRQTYFGTGETFLFSFSIRTNKDGKMLPTHYPWVSRDKSDQNGTAAENHAKELFMCGQHDMIAIGGGEGNGIYIDSSLTSGRTERCLTFNNPPLCTEGDFQIAAIEVFGLFRLDDF